MEEEFVAEFNEETDIYTESGLEDDMDSDSISMMEQGFMLGYLAS